MTTPADNVTPPSAVQLAAPRYTGTRHGERIVVALDSSPGPPSIEAALFQRGLLQAGYVLPARDELRGCVTTLPSNSLNQPCVAVFHYAYPGQTRDTKVRSSETCFAELVKFRDCSSIFRIAMLDLCALDMTPDTLKDEVNPHAWISTSPHTLIRQRAPFLWPGQVIRTTHCLDASLIPQSSRDRRGAVLVHNGNPQSPLSILVNSLKHKLTDRSVLTSERQTPVPGSPSARLAQLMKFKVAICPSHVHGYAAREIIESTAAGCIVLTDASFCDSLPILADNVVRVGQLGIEELTVVLHDLEVSYDAVRQRELATRAQQYYDYRAVGLRLSATIESMRGDLERAAE